MRIKGWDRFQHFKDRKPIWIKLYRELLDDLNWHELSGDDAKTLVMLWLIASENNGELPDERTLAFRLRVSEKSIKTTLSRLEHWVVSDRYQTDIKLISDGYQVDTLEKRREETDKEKRREEPARKRASQLPSDFLLTQEMREHALKLCPDMDTERTFADFQNYHLAKGSTAVDWLRSWMTWVSNCQKGFSYVRSAKPKLAVVAEPVNPFDLDRARRRVQPNVVGGEVKADPRLDATLAGLVSGGA